MKIQRLTREDVVAEWGEEKVAELENNTLLGINKPLIKTTYKIKWVNVGAAVGSAVITIILVLIN